MNIAVEVDQLTVRRRRQVVLDQLTLSVPSGQVVGLLGPSGSGKTTLLRAIVGVQRLSGGSVTVLGRPAGAVGLRRQIGYATQAASVYDDLTVTENLQYVARILGAAGSAVRRVLDETALGPQAQQLVGELSGGQRNRVSLAAALIGRPALLVLDEPTVGLDPVLRRDLWDLFHRLAATGTSLLVSSHVMDEASRCDRLLLLRAGRLLADDTPGGLLAATRTNDAEAAFLAIIGQDGAES